MPFSKSVCLSVCRFLYICVFIYLSDCLFLYEFVCFNLNLYVWVCVWVIVTVSCDVLTRGHGALSSDWFVIEGGSPS